MTREVKALALRDFDNVKRVTTFIIDHIDMTDTCWNWTGRVSAYGYGLIVVKLRGIKRDRCASRVMIALCDGEVPTGTFICHHCDNRCCVRPDHLFIGSPLDNMRDMYLKDRGPTGDRNGSRTHPERRPKGDQHWTRVRPVNVLRGINASKVRLNDDIVRQIRADHASGNITMASLARQHDVSESAIRHIIQRNSWAHVE